MNEKALKTLEYTKIIDQLTEYASTEMGKQMCRELQPSCDLGTIRQSQTETTDALTRVRMKGSLSFGGVKDVRGSMKRLEIGSSLGIPELLSVSSLLTVAARAQSYGRHEKSEEFPDDSLDERFRALDPLTPVNNEIKRCLPSEDEVSDDASPGLAKVRRSMKIVGGRVHTQLNSILNSSRTYLQDAVITMRDGRYCLPVKAEYKSQVPGMVHDQSSTGSTVFIEPLAIVKLNNELRELEIQEKREIEFVLAALSSQLMPYTDAILSDLSILAELDFIFAKAALSRHYNCVEPKFNNKLINLVNNAVKYTPVGSNIRITAIPRENMAEICVSDNGPGIPNELKEHVFEMFFTGGNPIGDSRRSLGLGLTLCQTIVHAHHGEMTLKDNSPHGCIFSFTIPLSEVNLNE